LLASQTVVVRNCLRIGFSHHGRIPHNPETALRRDPAKSDFLSINVFWDEDATIYINGIEAAKLPGFTIRHELKEISKGRSMGCPL
jgi:hypothetical protein